MVAGHRKKATELIGNKDRERENSKEMLKVVTPRKNKVFFFFFFFFFIFFKLKKYSSRETIVCKRDQIR